MAFTLLAGVNLTFDELGLRLDGLGDSRYIGGNMPDGVSGGGSHGGGSGPFGGGITCADLDTPHGEFASHGIPGGGIGWCVGDALRRPLPDPEAPSARPHDGSAAAPANGDTLLWCI